MIIDVWGQHPTLRHAQSPMFDSLRRWTKTVAPTEELDVAATIAMLDDGGDLPNETRKLFLWKNAQRVFKLNEFSSGTLK